MTTTPLRPPMVVALTTLLGVLAAACHDDPFGSTPTPGNSDPDSVASVDAGVDVDVFTSTDAGDAGACDPGDDGCGGAPASTSCGVCGLGVLENASSVTGAAECLGPSPGDLGLDDEGVVDCATQLVYLDPEAEPGG